MKIDDIFKKRKQRKEINSLRFDRLPFSTNGFCPDRIPSSRHVIHSQQIVIAYRAIFEVELSFENKKFYILIKRRFGRGLEALGKEKLETLTRVQRKQIKKDMRRQMKEFKDSSEAGECLNQPKGSCKLFCKVLFITQAK